MKDDHMKNEQLKPAYNVQLAVEAEYVIGVGIFPNANDIATLKPMFENMLRYNTSMIIRRFIADSGYESEENYTYLESIGTDCYIKPQSYEQQKKRSFKNICCPSAKITRKHKNRKGYEVACKPLNPIRRCVWYFERGQVV